MIKHFLNIVFVVLSLHAVQAQYAYFNQITGEIGDLSSELTANIEVVDDGYVIWGVMLDDGVLKHFVRKFNFDGEVIDENVLIFEDEYFYSGGVNSFQWNPHTEQFVVLQGSIIGEGVSGRLLTFESNLELDQNLVYDQYSPYTYFFGFLIEENGYVIYGEQGGLSNSNGTFIMKLDFEGNVVWNEIMQPEVSQHTYRNWSIVPLDSGYLIAGGGNMVGDRFGLVTIVNENGITQSETTVLDEDELITNSGGAVKLLNGEIMLCKSISFADIEEIEDPNYYWNKIRLEKFDIVTQEVYWQQDYHEDFEMILGGTRELMATADGGAILLGGRYGWYFDFYAWMMKVDADGNEEWFHEYTYENCDNCFNTLQDFELAPDGGYVAAGYFHNFDVDVRNNPWLLKVDACGDLEWQGCTVGVDEKEKQNFLIYPNPSAGRFMVSTESQEKVVGYEVVDMMGRIVQPAVAFRYTPQNGGALRLRRTASMGALFEIEIDAPTGLYLLRLALDDGNTETYRIEVVR